MFIYDMVLIFETNFENLLFIPLTQLVVIWIFVNYIFLWVSGQENKNFKDKHIYILLVYNIYMVN